MKHPKKAKGIGGVCPYCTRSMIVGHSKRNPTKDHIRPISRFGKRGEPARKIIVCYECNYMKSNHTLAEFLVVLESKNRELELAIAVNKDRIRNISYLLQIGIDED